MMRLKKVILSLFLVFAMSSCNGRSTEKWGGAGCKLKILSTTAQIGDLVEAVGGERIDGYVLIRGDLDPHSYEMVKGDGERLAEADLIFYNGLGLEHGASLATFLNRTEKGVAIGEKISIKYPSLILKRGDVVDPHIWMDVSLWQKAIDPIVEALSAADPEGAAGYRERGAVFADRMKIVHEEIRDKLQKIPSSKRYLITSHDAFHYFTRSYLADPGEVDWKDRFAAPEGLAPEGQLNPRDIQKIIVYMRQKNISVIFPESNVSRNSIRKIEAAGNELGLKIHICSEPLYGDSMSGLPYLEVMRRNGETLARNL